MSDQYVGEIRMFSGNYAPDGWHLCDGSTLPINGNEVLFSLIGVMYGGDGQTNFKLPDLRGRVPLHKGALFSSTYPLGSFAGVENVTLTESQLPAHTHVVNANKNAEQTTSNNPTNQFWGNSSITSYQTGAPNTNMHPQALSVVGSTQPHNNMMPTGVTNFIIALYGIYPTQA